MTARLRLLLAILVLALAPYPALAAGWAAGAPAMERPHGCEHPCDSPAGADHALAVCACGVHLALAPLAAAGQVTPVIIQPAVIAFATDATFSTRWPPPLRPPRS